MNVPAASTDLKRLSRDELTALLGKGKFRLSRGRDEIERNVNLDRTGREMYPLLIILVALVLGAEHLLANKFYRRDPQVGEKRRESTSPNWQRKRQSNTKALERRNIAKTAASRRIAARLKQIISRMP